MPNYLDILKQFKDRNRVSTTYNPVNPYSSAGYTGFDSSAWHSQAQKDVALQEEHADYVPEEMYTPPTTLEKGISAYQNVSQAGKLTGNQQIFGQEQLYQTGDVIPAGKEIGDVKSKAGLLAGIDASIGKSGVYKNLMGAPYGQAATSAYGTGKLASMNLPGSNLSAGSAGVIGSLAYALASDKNPYTYGTGEAVGMGIGDYMSTQAVLSAMPALSAAAPWLPIAAAGLGYLFRSKKSKKHKKKGAEFSRQVDKKYQDYITEARGKHSADYLYSKRGGQGNTMYGGYTNPIANAQADKGMKYAKYKYNTGGNLKSDVIAEFTGNELVVNDQNVVEQGLKEKNYSKAAAPIRKAMRGGRITPGEETHKNNPMPVDKEGTIYAGGGPLSFRVKHGAGIYDHASDQFKSTMSDKDIALTAQRNINKWKSNNMYS